jgi:hypothetical protein
MPFWTQGVEDPTESKRKAHHSVAADSRATTKHIQHRESMTGPAQGVGMVAKAGSKRRRLKGRR